MSEAVAIRVVCEGPTDTIVIRSAVLALGVEAVVTQIQPEDNSNLLGEYGGGWKGVRAWCQGAVKTGGLQVALVNTRALVVHVDADIAYDNEFSCNKPCPPARDTADAVRVIVLQWLGATTALGGVVLCVPAMATESWVFCALHATDKMTTGIECRREPAALLVPKKPKLVAKKGKRYAKDILVYKQVIEQLVAGWEDSIPRLCGEGARFLRELRAEIT